MDESRVPFSFGRAAGFILLSGIMIGCTFLYFSCEKKVETEQKSCFVMGGQSGHWVPVQTRAGYGIRQATVACRSGLFPASTPRRSPHRFRRRRCYTRRSRPTDNVAATPSGRHQRQLAAFVADHTEFNTLCRTLCALVHVLRDVLQHRKANHARIQLPSDSHLRPICVRRRLLSPLRISSRPLHPPQTPHRHHPQKHFSNGSFPSRRSHIQQHGNLESPREHRAHYQGPSSLP